MHTNQQKKEVQFAQYLQRGGMNNRVGDVEEKVDDVETAAAFKDGEERKKLAKSLLKQIYEENIISSLDGYDSIENRLFIDTQLENKELAQALVIFWFCDNHIKQENQEGKEGNDGKWDQNEIKIINDNIFSNVAEKIYQERDVTLKEFLQDADTVRKLIQNFGTLVEKTKGNNRHQIYQSLNNNFYNIQLNGDLSTFQISRNEGEGEIYVKDVSFEDLVGNAGNADDKPTKVGLIFDDFDFGVTFDDNSLAGIITKLVETIRNLKDKSGKDKFNEFKTKEVAVAKIQENIDALEGQLEALGLQKTNEINALTILKTNEINALTILKTNKTEALKAQISKLEALKDSSLSEINDYFRKNYSNMQTLAYKKTNALKTEFNLVYSTILPYLNSFNELFSIEDEGAQIANENIANENIRPFAEKIKKIYADKLVTELERENIDNVVLKKAVENLRKAEELASTEGLNLIKLKIVLLKIMKINANKKEKAVEDEAKTILEYMQAILPPTIFKKSDKSGSEHGYQIHMEDDVFKTLENINTHVEEGREELKGFDQNEIPDEKEYEKNLKELPKGTGDDLAGGYTSPSARTLKHLQMIFDSNVHTPSVVEIRNKLALKYCDQVLSSL